MLTNFPNSYQWLRFPVSCMQFFNKRHNLARYVAKRTAVTLIKSGSVGSLRAKRADKSTKAPFM